MHVCNVLHKFAFRSWIRYHLSSFNHCAKDCASLLGGHGEQLHMGSRTTTPKLSWQVDEVWMADQLRCLRHLADMYMYQPLDQTNNACYTIRFLETPLLEIIGFSPSHTPRFTRSTFGWPCTGGQVQSGQSFGASCKKWLISIWVC